MLASVLTGLLCGLAPALQSRKSDLGDALKDASRNVMGHSRHRLHNILVVTEIALSLILLIGAGMMLKSFARTIGQDRGFNPENVLTLHLTPSFTKYQEVNQRINLDHQVLDSIRKIPGVEGVGEVTGYPASDLGTMGSFQLSTATSKTQNANSRIVATFRMASSDYFQVMRIPLVAGRFFNEQDTLTSQPVTIVSQALAKRLWPNEDPIGQQLSVPYSIPGSTTNNGTFLVVGVVGDIKFNGRPASDLYMPRNQSFAFWTDLVIRTTKDPAGYVSAVRQQIREIDRDFVIERVVPMAWVVSDTYALERCQSFILGLFATLALALAAVGIYGLLSYSVNQRTQEIGIRMALGAQAHSILKMVLNRGLVLTSTGLVIGVAGAYGLIRVLQNQNRIFGLSKSDPLTFIWTSALLIIVAVLACYLPARRALRVDPMIALRND
jgi:putative ABC transport system permease protein